MGKKLVAHHVVLKLGKADGLKMKLDLRLPYEEAVLETVTNVDFPLFKSKTM